MMKTAVTRKRWWWVLLAIAGCTLPVFSEQKARALKLRLTGFPSDQGQARVEIFDSESHYAERKPAQLLSLGISNGMAETEMIWPEPRRVVIRVFHDENNNGTLDRTPLGVPDEPVGFSNNARSRFGPPTFREASIHLEPSTTDVVIRVERPLSTDWQIGVGWAVILRESPYLGGGFQAWTFPNIAYAGRRFSILGPRASYLITGGDRWKLSAVGQVRFNALDPDDHAELNGMEYRDVTWEMGWRLGLRGPHKVDIGFSALTDVLGRHGGQDLQADVSRSFRWLSWRFTPSLTATLLTDKLSDYYYGVSRDEERLPQRRMYSPGAAWTIAPSVRGFYERWYPWAVTFSLGLEYLGPAIADSPIVEQRALATGFLAVSRQFGPGARDR